MKKFRINVNGKAYEVEVEEIDGNSASAPQAVDSTVVANPAPKVVTPVPAANSAPAPATTTPIPANAEVVVAPMPGKIMSIKVVVGQQVKPEELILTLEAMKMENEIFCEAGGTVKEIRVSEGSAVNPGDALVVIG